MPMRDRTFLAVLSAFTLTICLLFLSSWASMRILSGIRAYVGGEGLYSKAQKNAVYFLAVYVHTRDENWYSRFKQSLRIPEGDRDARIELERPNPDLNVVRRGFIAGGNNPDDVDNLIFVFRRMRKTPYVDAAVKIWAEGDAEIARLRQLGDQIHALRPTPENANPFASSEMAKVEALNSRLTNLEDQFSSTLGAGARSTGRMLLVAILCFAIWLWATGALMFRRLIKALGSERETLRATVDNAPLGIVLVDAPNGRIRIGNSHAWNILGRRFRAYTEAEYADGLQAFSSEGSRLKWADFPVAKALSGEVIRAQDLRWIRPNGFGVWLRVSAAPIRRRGRIVGAVTAFYDISEERRVEEALVRQSQDLARSNADLEQFAYTTSHDLREPLRNIAIYSELLARRYSGPRDPETDRIVQVITSSVRRMNALIHDLLAYSRVNNVNAAPMSPVDLNQAVEWARGNLRAKIEENNAVIEVQQLPTVSGDKVQLVQVFQNLIENAIKYRGPMAPVVRISAETTNGYWTLVVRDNGIGIEAQYHLRIFGIFKRLHGQDVPGTGIGLALTKRVVERHGGQIWVESKIGQGSTFRFTLPRVESKVPDESESKVDQVT